MSAGGWSSSRLDRMREVMAGHVERGDLPGLVTLVSRRGEVHAAAFGSKALAGGDPMRRDTLFRIASMSKPIAAVAAMILVEECRLRLDDPVDRFLPELADRKVLKRIDGPLDDVVPANRSITLRDLLTLRLGLGYLMVSSREYPILKALEERQILQGPPRPQTAPSPDEWMRRVGSLPLMAQPGERWMYDLGIDLLGVLIARASGQPLDRFMSERIFEPLGMKDTGFSVPEGQLDRLATSYWVHPVTGSREFYDGVEDSHWRRLPPFPSASGGLVSTADDCLAFGQMMLDYGKFGRERILSRHAVEVMTSDQLTSGQQAGAGIILGESRGWGFGMSVFIRRDDLGAVPGRFGWDGGLGTSWYTDPRDQLVGILLTQQAWTSPVPPPIWSDFWTSAYQAIED